MKNKLIELPESKYRSTRDTGEAYPCIVCGKAVTSKKPKYLRIVEGGSHAVLPEFQNEYDGDAGDLGQYPIGGECLRNYPGLRPYIQSHLPKASPVENYHHGAGFGPHHPPANNGSS